MANFEIVRSGVRDGKFQLFCISEVENGNYIVFTLAVEELMGPHVETDRESAIKWLEVFFEESGTSPHSLSSE